VPIRKTALYFVYYITELYSKLKSTNIKRVVYIVLGHTRTHVWYNVDSLKKELRELIDSIDNTINN